MRHNERRAKTIRGILALEKFTAAELAANAGLNREQVYEIIAELKKEGTLSAEISKPSGAAHRPINLYCLQVDPDVRRRLAEEIAPFVPLTVDEKTEAWRRADRSLDEIDLALAELTNDTRSLWTEGRNLHSQATELKARLDEVNDDLEIAFYESGARSMTTADPVLTVDAKRLTLYRSRLNELIAKAENAEALSVAQQRFSEWMRELIQMRNLTVHDVTESSRAWARKSESSDFRRMLHGTVTELNTCVFSESERSKSRATRRRSSLLGSYLAETTIRCSADANVLVDVLHRWKKAPDESRWHYNFANAFALLGDRTKARNEWQQWAGNYLTHEGTHCVFRTAGFRYPCYRNLAVFSVQRDCAKRDSVDRLERELGEVVTSSVVAFERLPEFEPRHYRVVPTLFDPVGHAPYVEVAETLRAKQPDFFVYGSLGHRMQLPGVPVVRLATVLVSLGMRDTEAWGVADHFDSGQVLVIAYSADRLNHPPTQRLKEVFGTKEVITSRFFESSTPGEPAVPVGL